LPEESAFEASKNYECGSNKVEPKDFGQETFLECDEEGNSMPEE
jgi:hypothetical protein